jgi:hypothetical protein
MNVCTFITVNFAETNVILPISSCRQLRHVYDAISDFIEWRVMAGSKGEG